MRQVLYNFDIFPKVVLAGEDNLITIKPLGWHAGIAAGRDYEIVITASEQGDSALYPEWAHCQRLSVTPSEDQCLRFHCTLPSEQEYFVRLTSKEANLNVLLSLYALGEDMKGRYPYRGDLHVHTRRSDGQEAPEIVCANYRALGYDFMVVSDHMRYYPSLEAIRLFGGVAPDFTVVPGEEVQMPLTDVHIINFGGRYSVNALVDGNCNQKDRGDDPRFRSEDGICPPVMSREAYEKQVRELAKRGWFQSESADMSFAACVWAYDRIREAGGLGIFCHPYWRVEQGYQIPEKFLDKMLEEHPFDAFEVLGGEHYYEQNGFQTAKYCETLAKGIHFPIVGSTDTHGSTEHNDNQKICSSIIFARENARDALIEAIRGEYSLAVDTISREFRLVGSLRLQKYACFLMQNFYPLHDRLCQIQGEYLRQFALGEAGAAEHLKAVEHDAEKLMKKYFALL